MNGDLGKTIDEAITKKPFSLATIFAILAESDPPKIAENKNFLDKCLQTIDLPTFGRFKLNPMAS